MKKNVVKLSLAVAALAVGFSGCSNKYMDKLQSMSTYKTDGYYAAERMNNHNAACITENVCINLSVNFATNSAVIDSSSLSKVKRLVKYMKENPETTVEISGYTDDRASEAYNMDLSKRRADAVANQIIKYGIGANRVSSKGYGEANPVASNATAEGRHANRRIEATVR